MIRGEEEEGKFMDRARLKATAGATLAARRRRMVLQKAGGMVRELKKSYFGEENLGKIFFRPVVGFVMVRVQLQRYFADKVYLHFFVLV